MKAFGSNSSKSESLAVCGVSVWVYFVFFVVGVVWCVLFFNAVRCFFEEVPPPQTTLWAQKAPLGGHGGLEMIS